MSQFMSRWRTHRPRTGRLANATLFAVVAALIALPVPSAQANVTAHDADCRDSEEPVQTADALLADVYQLGAWPARKLDTDLTWTEDPFDDNNWKSNLHGLRWTTNLMQAELIKSTGVYAARLYEVLADWEKDNPRPGAESDWAWGDHTTAARALVLACINDVLQPAGANKELVDRMLVKHGDTLRDDDFYVKFGNHALDQALALLEVGRVLKTTDPDRSEMFIAKAEERLNDYVGRSVDTQGVMNEQSVFYQWYNYHRYLIVLDRLRDAGLTVGPVFDRVELMPDFLAHATLPNGRWEMIGDTQDKPAVEIPGTIAEYAATRGACAPSCPTPDSTVRRFDAGYLFARSGWGRPGIRNVSDETFFSTKWGPAPVLHGHNDGMSLTLASWGARLLIDSGLYKYGGGPFRNYMWSRPAHNIVTVDGAKWNSKAASGRVIDNTLTSSKFVDLQLRTYGYPGVIHTRRITYSRALDYLIVDDQLSSKMAHTYRQLWHLGWDANPVVSGSNVYTRRKRGNVLIAQLYGRPAPRIVKGSTSPIQGWTSYSYAQLAKTPTVEAIQKGRSVRYITLLAPAAGQPKPTLKSFRATSGGYQVTLKIGTKTETLTVNGKTVTVK